jgi:hypothetical protein
VIQVSIEGEKFGDLKEDAYVRWGFESKDGNRLVAAMKDEDFAEFLRVNNLIVYKNHIKEYQDGDVLGDFTLAEPY